MKKKVILLWSLFAAMTFSACTENNDAPINENAKSNLTVKFNFTGTETRALSTAVPTTSWTNIDQVQLFLYDVTTGEVKYSKIVKPAKTGDAGTLVTGTGYQYTYADVPVGEYRLVAVANANRTTGTPTVGGLIDTYIDDASTATTAVWSDGNVRAKDITTDIFIKHQAGEFPTFLDTSTPGFSTANKAYKEPAEIFMGTAPGTDSSNPKLVKIVEGETTVAGVIPMKREVALMRVRMNVHESAAGVNNTSTAANGVDWTKDASILIYRLPGKVNIHDARQIQASVGTDVLSISGTSGVFNTADPAADTGYGTTPGKILDATMPGFSMWRDIVVFPNLEDAAPAKVGKAAIGSQYFIVVSGQAKAGHVLADGTVLTVPTTVYWSGVILDVFKSNVIREVNLTLKTGGVGEPPLEPIEYGGLDVTVGDPIDWSSQIVSTDIDV